MTKQQFFRSGPLLGIIAVALIWVASAATPADALVAAGTSIDNQATVSYTEGAPVLSNTVSTTVNLVSGLAWDAPSLTPTTQTAGASSALPLAYTADLVNLGNGATTATVTDGTTQDAPANLTAGAWTINGVASPAIVLGGTVSSAAAIVAGANTNIPVSNVDLTALVAGDTVRIGGVTGTDYIVATGSTATNLVVVGDATADVAAAGVQIGEMTVVTFNGTTGALQNSSLSQIHLHAMTATDDVGGGNNADGNAAATDTINSDGTNPWQTNVVAGVLTITKYVRNVTTGNAGTGPAFPYGGNNYYLAGVTGNSTTDTLEYLIVLTNAGPGDTTDVTVTDTISTFLALTTTSVDIDTNGDGTFDVTDAVSVASDAATFVSPLLTVYAGTGGVASTTTGGTITAAAGTSAVRFQAAIQ